MPSVIAAILESRTFLVLARVELTFVFWSSGLAKLFGFDGALLEMEKFHLQPSWLFAAATVIVLLGGSLAIILNRGVWLGTGALAVFTLLTIPIAHAFWNKSGDDAFQHMVISFEHVSMVGGLALAAILSKTMRTKS